MEKYIYTKKSIITFFITVIVLSIIVDILYFKTSNGILMLVLMWMPAVSCIISNIVNLIEKKEKFNLKVFLNNCGFRKSKIIYIILGILLPLIYLYIPYRIYWTMYPNNYAYSGVKISLVLSDILPTLIIGVFINLLSATGEEIGWRGFLTPALNERIGYKKTLIISNLFWCLWHFPLLIWGGYMAGTPLWYALIAFVLCILPVGIICGLLRLNSNSMWPAAFLHAAHNNYDQGVFGLITRGDNMMYFVSETGIFTIICAWIIAIIMIVKYEKESKNVKNF